MRQEDVPRRYVILKSDRYDADVDTAFLRILSRDSGYAGRWLKRLGEVLADLAGFPGPVAHAVDEEATAALGREVRRLLYYGPTRRRSGTPARILYAVLPPDEDAESVILLLRLLHGPQSLVAPEDPA